jgi:hypothetical protein
MAFGTVQADVIGTSVANSNLGAGDASLMKNRIINGAMVIDQRNAGASTTPTTTGAVIYALDRWGTVLTQASKFSIQQNAGSVTPPAGFTNYVGITSLSAYTVGSTDNFNLQQRIEGFNTADLGWGTANAKTVTLSFWVRSSLTGTFGGAVKNSASDRSYPYSYTISASNTWEQKTITIAGDTTGTWIGATNGIGIAVLFGLGVGSTLSGTAGTWAGASYASATGATSVVGTNGATFYITGVQIEVGTSATGFEYVNYQTSLANCQRYYQRINGLSLGNKYCLISADSTTNATAVIPFKVSMRTSPTALDQSGTAADYSLLFGATNTACSAVPAFSSATTEQIIISLTVASGLTSAAAGLFRNVATTAYVGWSAEL